LEAYVLGSLTDEESAEVLSAINQYPEVAAEVAAIEETVFRFAGQQAAPPPPHLQDRIWAAIESGSAHQAPPPAETTGPRVMPLTPERRQGGWMRAAVWAVLIGSLITNFILWQQRSREREQQIVLQQRVDTLEQRQQYLAGALDRYKQEAEMMADPGMQAIVMQTTKKERPMAATIFWSKAKGEAYVSVQKLPMPPRGKQYQLWVIAGGKPVDLGVLPNEMISGSGMQRVPASIADGQAFAISLEQEGGSPVPTMEQIYVLGKVSS
jgi:anti-sigma-K factor RskA